MVSSCPHAGRQLSTRVVSSLCMVSSCPHAGQQLSTRWSAVVHALVSSCPHVLFHHYVWSAAVHTLVSSCPHVMSLFIQEGQRCRMRSAIWSFCIPACPQHVVRSFSTCLKRGGHSTRSLVNDLHSVYQFMTTWPH